MTLGKKVIVFFVFFSLLTSLFPGLTRVQAIKKDLPITIEVNDRLELLGVIRILDKYSNYFACEILNTVFKRDAVAWFKNYKNHPAVLIYQKSIASGDFTDSQCREFILLLGDFPDLKVPENLPCFFQKDEWFAWRKELLCFCEATNFSSFLLREKELYQQVPDQFILPLKTKEDLEKIGSFFNEQKWSIRFLLSPLLFQENQFVLVQNDQDFQCVFIFGLSGIDNGRLLFASNEIYANFVRDLLLKNMSKIVLDRFSDKISKLEPLLNPIKKQMESQDIRSWKECFVEHIFLSANILLFSKDPTKEIQAWREKGFLYLSDTYELFLQYEQYRNYFSTFYSFIPRILTQYERILRSQK